jgi:hypothetical protein
VVGAKSSWLVAALTEAMLGLVVLSASGASRLSVDLYSPSRETDAQIAAPPAVSHPPEAKLTPDRQQPRRRWPISVAERQAMRTRRFAAERELPGLPVQRRRFRRRERPDRARFEVDEAAETTAHPN